MSYHTEFPSFVLPVELPAGFEDTSWHHDACPSFTFQLGGSDANRLVIWIEFEDVAHRDSNSIERFVALVHDISGVPTEIVRSNDWPEVLRWVVARMP